MILRAYLDDSEINQDPVSVLAGWLAPVSKGVEAIRTIRWPVRVLLFAVAATILTVAWRAQPIYWLVAAGSYIKSLL
jgi:hypothetical protein